MWCFSPPGSALRRCWRWPTPAASGASFTLHYYVSRAQEVAFATEIARQLAGGICQIHCSDEGQSPRQRLAQDLGLRTPTPGSTCGPPDLWPGFAIPHGRPDGRRRNCTAKRSSRPPRRRRRRRTEPSPSPSPPPGALAGAGDKTIARVLQEHGVAVPLSCEMGICGACLTPVREGTVDHRDTVQSEAEKQAAEQHIALCALQPVGQFSYRSRGISGPSPAGRRGRPVSPVRRRRQSPSRSTAADRCR